MYRVNLFLRIIFTIVLFFITLFLNNYYLFWLLLFYMLFISLVDRNYKSLLINFAIVLILLFCFYTSKIRILLVFLFLINILYVFITSFHKYEIIYLRYLFSKRFRKNFFYDNNINKIIDYNQGKVKAIYGDVSNIDKKVKADIDSLYLYGKVRFYEYGNKISSFSSFGIYDFIFLFLFIVLLTLFCIYW